MDTVTKKKKDASAKEGAASPVKVFRMDEVSASIFARKGVVQGEPVTFHSVSFSRSYKDAKGERHYTKNFDSRDMSKIMLLAKQAGEFIDTRPPLKRVVGED